MDAVILGSSLFGVHEYQELAVKWTASGDRKLLETRYCFISWHELIMSLPPVPRSRIHTSHFLQSDAIKVRSR